MAYGLLSINDGGTVQIDETFSAVGLVAKGTTLLARDNLISTGASLPYQWGSSSSFVAHNPMIGVCGLTEHVAAYPQDLGGGNWQCDFVATDSTGVADTAQWFAFDFPLLPSADGWGTRVWDSGSNLTFDSGWGLFNPRAFVNGAYSSVAGNHTSLSGRTYVGLEYKDPVQTIVLVDTTNPFHNDLFYAFLGFKRITDGVSLGLAPAWVDTVGGPFSQTDAHAMLVDVTIL